jgi:integrase
VQVGLHAAIDSLNLEDDEQTSSDAIAPDDLASLLRFYRGDSDFQNSREHAILELIAHTGVRRSGVRAVDVSDWNHSDRIVELRNRPENGTRLKEGAKHNRKVVLSQKPAEVIQAYVQENRFDKHDEVGRQPLFTSREGRPNVSTVTNWIYQSTIPCRRKECPHNKEKGSCDWTVQSESCKCPSSSSPHPARRGSITWQLNIGRSIQNVAARAGTTPDVIRRYYDKPSLDAELRRRITEFNGIDVCKHSVPEDVKEDAGEGQ